MQKFLRVVGATLASFGLTILMPLAVHADPAPITAISGFVKSGSGPVNGANVTVICNSHTQTATTSSGGAYLVVFPLSQCPSGSHFTVSVLSAGKSGSGSGTISSVTTKLNINVGGDISLPEMGTITGFAGLAI